MQSSSRRAGRARGDSNVSGGGSSGGGGAARGIRVFGLIGEIGESSLSVTSPSAFASELVVERADSGTGVMMDGRRRVSMLIGYG